MTLEEFTTHLREMDMATDSAEAKYFECEVAQINEKQFAFTYDGLCRCQIIFNEDGTVAEYQEQVEDEPLRDDHFLTFSDVEEWKEISIKAINEWTA